MNRKAWKSNATGVVLASVGFLVAVQAQAESAANWAEAQAKTVSENAAHSAETAVTRVAPRRYSDNSLESYRESQAEIQGLQLDSRLVAAEAQAKAAAAHHEAAEKPELQHLS